MFRSILALLIFLLGAALAAGGVWLTGLGGSWGYLVLALPLLLSAVLLLRRRRAGLTAYALVIALSLAWAVWEVGFDWWAMAPRLGLIALLGALLLLPPVVRSLAPRPGQAGKYGVESASLVGVLGIGLVVAAVSFFSRPHEIDGDLPADRMAALPDAASSVNPGEWSAYGRTAAGQRYSPLDQIHTGNVKGLEKAWEYHAGDIHPDLPGSALESTPLVVNDTMYVCTPRSEVIALDPVTGKERWRFDPQLVDLPRGLAHYTTCRGVSYDAGDGTVASANRVPEASAEQAEALRAASRASATTQAAGVSHNTVVGTAQPGDPNPVVAGGAAVHGDIPLRRDCGRRVFITTRDARLIALSAETGVICPGFGGADGTVNLWQGIPNVSPGAFYATSPGLVAGKVIVVGGGIDDNLSTTLPSGVVRAFDLRTGALVWNFDAGNPGATAPLGEGKTYTENAPNSWSVASYDPELNLVYLPFGVSSPDQYGVGRSAAVEKYSTSVTALDASTGAPRWTFQTVHHDLWDYDVPAQPSLIDLTIDGQRARALVQPTKQGEVFVLDRATGKPLLPVREVPVSQRGVTGERLSPTQPVSAISFAPKDVTGAQMWGMTPVDQMLCRIDLAKLHYEGRFTPPSEQGTLTHPGSFGVLNWGAVAVDPARQMMFAMPVYLGFTAKLVKRPESLEKVVSRPGKDTPMGNENFGAPYASIVKPFMSRLGLPCQQPPWGYIAGVDLTNGKTVYRRVNGTVRDMAPLPLPFKTGVPGIGGPIVTAGGLAFLSGTVDYYVRGYDLADGQEVWRARLPAGGQSTPATYLGRDGRQYLVVVAGGHRYTGTKTGDSVIAYALPSKTAEAR